MANSLLEIVQSGDLPIEAQEIIPLLTNEDGTYLSQEATVWDFKESWPFSYSDAYFAGICRLICAFANAEGGLIIFGVDDKSRKGGRTKIAPNLDRLEQAFEALTGRPPDLQLRRYKNALSGDIDVLLVRRKSYFTRPFRFIRPVDGYPDSIIYIRKGSQVREATSSDIATLYLRSAEEDIADPPRGQLPPSPATVREFVGRMDAIDRVFNWLSMEDEPRAFLFGKGGSGKSTIAYQVYKSIKVSGDGFKIAGTPLERLIYISAKSRYLDVESQKAEKFVGIDFRNETELYQAILILGDHEIEPAKMADINYLKDNVKAFLNNTCSFIVIDDIDTLSTAEEETGTDFLLGALWKAKKPSKILYTLRNRPTQSLSSSLEIPGMTGPEFNRFVQVCASQFGVPEPKVATRDAMIFKTSEGRPLVVESIVALRRSAGNYPDAVQLFESEAGNDVRDYVFRREWDALDKTDRGREILAILALYNKPIAVEDIVIISKLDASKVRDALASVQEIFLNTELSNDETLYSIGSLTRDFVLSSSQSLNLYDTVKARVENFKNTFYADSPALNSLLNRFHRASAAFEGGEERYLRDLLLDLDGEKDPKLAEDPRFLCLRGTARLSVDLKDISRARSDFRTAMDFKHSPDTDQLMLWLRAEKQGDSGDKMTAEILERVQKSKGYDLAFKTRVRFDRACYLYIRGKNALSVEPHKAVDLLSESLNLHLQALKSFFDMDSPNTSRSEEYARNTCFTLGNHLNHSSEPDQFLSIISGFVKDEKIYVDILLEPIFSFMRYALIGATKRKEVLQKRMSRYEKLVLDLNNSPRWLSKARKNDLERD